MTVYLHIPPRVVFYNYFPSLIIDTTVMHMQCIFNGLIWVVQADVCVCTHIIAYLSDVKLMLMRSVHLWWSCINRSFSDFYANSHSPGCFGGGVIFFLCPLEHSSIPPLKMKRFTWTMQCKYSLNPSSPQSMNMKSVNVIFFFCILCWRWLFGNMRNYNFLWPKPAWLGLIIISLYQ